ncbi:TPA: NYN domain-containing protein [Candidatus Nomurabacteria bacterium]|nr:MAG: hypothetical protein O210_OD1C00001G0003 [Parcubacteria bacterium RAAC4_OD1_1]HCY26730.1 NYN domain-containing protein [Candidatus Nomurabacteria bacterium]
MEKDINNIAFIDGQNLYLGTKQDGWSVDLTKLRIYLKDKYKIKDAYYFLGYLNEENNELYKQIQKSGFIVVFKEHNEYALTKKKGNVDTDIVFEIMKSMIDNNFNKIVLVSGDGDYKKVVDYLIEKDRFEKILFPNIKFASSLYKKLGNNFFTHLGREDVKIKIKN